MAIPDHSDFQSQGEVESTVQSTNQKHPDSHESPSVDPHSSIFSLTLDEFERTFSGDIGSFGSMNMEMDELLDNILTEEEIEAFVQTLVPSPSITLSAAAPMEAAIVPTAAATTNINPQFPEGEINASSVNDTAIQQSLLRQGSLRLPSPLSQKTVDELWDEIQKLQQEQENCSTTNVQEVNSAQRQETSGEMTLEDFLVMVGVIRGPDHPPSPLLQHSCVSYQNNNSSALAPAGPPGHMVRTVMASGGGGNEPAYQALPERSVKDAASIAVGKIPSGYQPIEVLYGGKMQNNAVGGGCGQRSPTSPVSSDSIGANQSDSAYRCNYPVEKVETWKQRRMIKNRESAARSRARRQAYTSDLEAELQMLKEENAHLRQALAKKRVKQQDMGAKDRKKGLKRSWSCMY